MRILMITALILTSPYVAAWGSLGHQTVCEIAYQELSPEAREVVDALLAEEAGSTYSTFHAACTWPDSQSPLTNARRHEHFINWVRSWSSVDKAECQSDDGCLFSAIPKDRSILENPDATGQDRWNSLKFFGHWLGDIHQPLHVAYLDDHGGNDIKVGQNLGCSQNLHATWDTCSVEHAMEERGFEAGNDVVEAFAGELLAAVSAEERLAWLEDMAPLEWASESYAVTRADDTEYCVIEGKRCQYSSTQLMLVDHEHEKTLDIDEHYLDAIRPIVETRLQQAGIRLGALLKTLMTDD